MGVGPAPAENPDHDEHGNDGQVLGQQHTDGVFAHLGPQPSGIFQVIQHHGCTGQADHEAQQNDTRRRPAHECANAPHDRNRGGDLGEGANHGDAPVCDQPLGRRLHADKEQQEHHAEFAQPRHRMLIRHHAQPVRAKNDPGQQIPDDMRLFEDARRQTHREDD